MVLNIQIIEVLSLDFLKYSHRVSKYNSYFWTQLKMEFSSSSNSKGGVSNHSLKSDSAGVQNCISVRLMNRPIDFISIKNLIQVMIYACKNNSKLFIASCNIHSFNMSMQVPWFYDYLNKANFVRCDGMGILKTVNYLGLDISTEYKASGTNLVPRLLEESRDNNLSFFFLGSKPSVLEKAINNVKQKYPGIQIQGYHGYFDKENSEENAEVLEKISKMRPNVLIVGMGRPIQEHWIHQHRDKIEANVVLPCGAVIDRLAGKVPNAPDWMTNVGLEWLYRLSREPKRLSSRYLLGNPAFLLNVLLCKSYTEPMKIKDRYVFI